jgi:hypothetical protein
MNCAHHTSKPPADNEFLSTACSLKTVGGQRVNKPNQPMKSAGNETWPRNYSPPFGRGNSGGEKLPDQNPAVNCRIKVSIVRGWR